MRLAVTAGHGGGDTGAVRGQCREADLMVDLRDRVAERLRELGHEVLEDGADGQNLPLVSAIALARGADMAVELHTNAVENPAASGVEVVALPQRKADAQRVAQAIAEVLGLRARGAGGWVDQSVSPRGRLGFVGAGGMVVEVFFLSNPLDLARYLERTHDVAEAIVTGMVG